MSASDKAKTVEAERNTGKAAARSRANETAADKPAQPPLEPLDEKSLESVMRDAPL